MLYDTTYIYYSFVASVIEKKEIEKMSPGY